MTPPLVMPRYVPASGASNDETPAGAMRRAQAGPLQARDYDRAGRAWEETYPLLNARDSQHMELLTRLQWFRGRSKLFWIDHPLLPGSGLAPNGTGEENLLRSAAMDTDTNADGVVDSFIESTVGSATLTLDNAAQKMHDADTGAANSPNIRQRILRIFPGDQITVSVEYETANLVGNTEARVFLRWSDGSFQTILPGLTQAGPVRVSHTVTAPAGVDSVDVWYQLREFAASDTGDVWFRKARLLRASSDPATWANPHVSGAGQTGDTLATAGWPPSTTVMRAGDLFRVGGSGATVAAAETDEVVRSFKVLEDVVSDGSGNATLSIDPPIFSGLTVPDGAALRLRGVRLKAGIIGGNFRQPSRLVQHFGGLSAIYAEAV